MIKKSIIFLIVILLTSCVKRNIIDQLPQVKVVTLNEKKDTLKGTLVEIYKNKSDWEKRENKARFDTAHNGFVLFDHLVQRQFYFYAEWKVKRKDEIILITTRNSGSFLEIEGLSNTIYQIDLTLK